MEKAVLDRLAVFVAADRWDTLPLAPVQQDIITVVAELRRLALLAINEGGA